MSLVFIDNNNKEFSKAMKDLVSDDSKNRENGLEEIKKILTSIKIKNYNSKKNIEFNINKRKRINK